MAIVVAAVVVGVVVVGVAVLLGVVGGGGWCWCWWWLVWCWCWWWWRWSVVRVVAGRLELVRLEVVGSSLVRWCGRRFC
eukprot:COSAG02_NODE_5359_length_4399_cov_8.574651_1_plen_79_part_00